MAKEVPVEYINKTIYTVCRGLKLKHQVKFGRKDQKGTRTNGTYVSTYESHSYDLPTTVSSVYIDTCDYLVLDYREGKDQRLSIYLSYPHLYTLKLLLQKAIKWFTVYADKLYIYTDDEIRFNSKYKKLKVSTDNTIDHKTITLRPNVIEKRDAYMAGVYVHLNDEYITTMSADELMAFNDVIQQFDLYQNSLMMTTYMLSNYPASLVGKMLQKVEQVPSRPDPFAVKHRKKAEP
jgi:hypothetical protein